MYIIAFDPGATTGVCILYSTGERAPGSKYVDINVIKAGQVLWDDRLTLEQWIAVPHRRTQVSGSDPNESELYVIYEGFRLYPHMAAGQAKIRSSFPSVEVIGMIKAWCAQLGIKDDHIIEQPAALRKSVRLLPEHSALVKGVHAKDAYRHGRYFIVSYYNKNKRSRK
jgi:hypothetical protein